MGKNYNLAVEKIRKVKNNCVFKNITLTGRITVAKTFMLSKVSHIASISPTPSKSVCDLFDKTIYNFILGKNPEAILNQVQ